MNIKTFGQVDQRSLEQLMRCMVAGDAAYGVLCADHHPGYAQPIGSAIAYKDKISVSGVGYDIGCLDEETEFLSPSGWKKIKDWSGELVLQYDKNTNIAQFSAPLRFISKPCDKFYHLKHSGGLDQKLSPDHKILIFPGYKNRYSKPQDYLAEEFVAKHSSLAKGLAGAIKTTFDYSSSTNLNFTSDEIRVAVMISADGVVRNNTVELHFKKHRKIERARKLLENAGIPFKESIGKDSSTYISFKFENANKELDIFLYASPEQLKIVADECFYWDGHIGNKHSYYSTTNKNNADLIQFALAVCGIRSGIYTIKSTNPKWKDNYYVYKTSNSMIGLTKNCVSESQSADGRAYCFTMSSGYFVARRNNNIFITGNCGNTAWRLDCERQDIEADMPSIMDAIYKEISFGMGRKNSHPIPGCGDELMEEIRNSDFTPLKSLAQLASDQLGTVGGGNHYVDVFYDERDNVWIGCHFGSRGFGHKIASGFISLSKGGKFNEKSNEGEMDSDPILFDVNSSIGKDYLYCMNLAGMYAAVGRDSVLSHIAYNILGADKTLVVNNHHNYAWKEKHYGEDFWIVRKGCTPLKPENGDLSFVGANMANTSVIVKGIDSEESKESLNSTIHGAGRIMSRRAAAGKTKYVNGVKTIVKPGLVDWNKVQSNIKPIIELRGGGPDEAPEVYKDLMEVLGYHIDTTHVVDYLYPMGVAMAGEEDFDLYKD